MGSPTWPKVELHLQLPATKPEQSRPGKDPRAVLFSAKDSSLRIEVFCQSGSLEARVSKILTRVPFIQSPSSDYTLCTHLSESKNSLPCVAQEKVQSIKSRGTDFLMLLITGNPFSGKDMETL